MSTELEDRHIHDVKVYDSENLLGYLSVVINRDEIKDNPSWRGNVLGSDYLVWGLNHRKVRLEFEDGVELYVVVRSGGSIAPVPAG